MNELVAVIGLGYVGLPLASLCAKRGYSVIGYEINDQIRNSLQQQQSPIKDQKVETLLNEAFESQNLTVTNDPNALKNVNFFLVCVPTPVDDNQDPDLSPLIGALEDIAPYINADDTVVIESTVFPGTCEQVVQPLLENATGMRAGLDFEIAHCPERVNPGDHFWTVENIPRVIGALSKAGVEKSAAFYASILAGEVFDVQEIRGHLRPKFGGDAKDFTVKNIPGSSITMMRSIRDAEAVKAMENTVRDVNIAFVNELAKISDVLALDVVDIIDGMSTKPFGKGPFFPGVGVGGHCIAVDPEWLKTAAQKAGYMPEIIQLARKTNNSMPAYTVSLMQDALNKKSRAVKNTRITILGVAYKKNVDDPRESPFFEVLKLLQQKEANVVVYDPWVTLYNTVSSLEEALEDTTAVLIVTDHDETVDYFSHYSIVNSSIEIIIDGRNCLNATSMAKYNVIYRGIGRNS